MLSTLRIAAKAVLKRLIFIQVFRQVRLSDSDIPELDKLEGHLVMTGIIGLLCLSHV